MESISIRVLLADDEAAIRNGLQNAIPWEQYHAKVVAVASNGQEALDLINSYRPDLVIIDIKMPQLDGLEVIRRTKAAGITCRFLILSGYDDFYLAQKAIRYGANGYFLKPLKIEEFKDVLVIYYMIESYPVRKSSAYLFVPYLLWSIKLVHSPLER